MKDAERERDGELIGPASGPVTEGQIEADLARGKIYRLNDRFFKFLFGREERKHLFLDLVNSLTLALSPAVDCAATVPRIDISDRHAPQG